jgi:ankyrin repeat protein
LDQVIDTKYNLTALHVAASTNSYAMIEYLLLNGASIDLKDPFGNSPLAYAAINDCFEATRSLIERGAKIDTKDKYGYTIL